MDTSWLLNVAKRMTAAAPSQRAKYHLITSDRLYLLGLELMDCAVAEVNSAGRINKAQAFRYRDGLIIALLAMIPLRSGTLTALRIGHHLVKVGGLWALDIPAADTKSRRALDYPIAGEISKRIDLYLEQFRSRIPGADKHAGLWASNKGRPRSRAPNAVAIPFAASSQQSSRPTPIAASRSPAPAWRSRSFLKLLQNEGQSAAQAPVNVSSSRHSGTWTKIWRGTWTSWQTLASRSPFG